VSSMKRSSVLSAAGLMACLCACQQPTGRDGVAPGDKPPVFYEDIVWVSLMVQTPLIDEDRDKIPEGISVIVYLTRPNQSDFVAGRGRMVFRLIKKTKAASGRMEDVELRKWEVSEEQFTRGVVRQGFGLVCHRMALYWENLNPRGSGIYLRGEFIRKDGQRVMSRPVSLILPDNPRAGS